MPGSQSSGGDTALPTKPATNTTCCSVGATTGRLAPPCRYSIPFVDGGGGGHERPQGLLDVRVIEAKHVPRLDIITASGGWAYWWGELRFQCNSAGGLRCWGAGWGLGGLWGHVLALEGVLCALSWLARDLLCPRR